ncbi:hypothetical protein D3C78_1475730 [compost metagenome]
MLILYLLLPAGFSHARDLAFHGEFAQLVTCQTEFTEYTARATSQCAAATLANRASITRQGLQLQTSSKTLFFGKILVIDDSEERFTLAGVLSHELSALLFTINQS